METSETLFLILTVLLYVWAVVLVLLTAAVMVERRSRGGQRDVIALAEQVRRLVLANNIDRAIKLCNAEEKLIAAEAFKTLLIRAHRPHELTFALQTAGVVVRAAKGPKSSRWSWAFGGVVVFAAFIAAGWIPPSAGPVLALVVVGVADGLNRVSRAWARTALYETDLRLTELWMRLHLRTGYVPPECRPRPVGDASEDELAAWEARLAEFEDGIAATRAAGEDVEGSADVASRFEAVRRGEGGSAALPPL